MRRVLNFSRNEEVFLMMGFYAMRCRIPAATMPHTSRNYLRKHGRIPSLNRKDSERFFLVRTTCAMAYKKRLPQGFLLALGVWSVA